MITYQNSLHVETLQYCLYKYNGSLFNLSVYYIQSSNSKIDYLLRESVPQICRNSNLLFSRVTLKLTYLDAC